MSQLCFATIARGGILYHWLGLQFRSPFINLYLTTADFLSALEHLADFLSAPIDEVKDSPYTYPVGRSQCHGELLHFMHYHSFAEAYQKWNERKLRVNWNNMGVISNYLTARRFIDQFDYVDFINHLND